MSIQIQLSRGEITKIDDCDFDLCKYKWYSDHGYAIRNISQFPFHKIERLHRVILSRMLGRPLLNHEQVDHINCNSFDNARNNLRLCTPHQNRWNRKLNKNNSSGYKGVKSSRNKWRATIQVNNQEIDLGSFTTPEDAAHAYDDAARLHFGIFAKTNF